MKKIILSTTGETLDERVTNLQKERADNRGGAGFWCAIGGLYTFAFGTPVTVIAISLVNDGVPLDKIFLNPFLYMPLVGLGFLAHGLKEYYDAHSNKKEIEYLRKGYY